jgi:hypothetical protein
MEFHNLDSFSRTHPSCNDRIYCTCFIVSNFIYLVLCLSVFFILLACLLVPRWWSLFLLILVISLHFSWLSLHFLLLSVHLLVPPFSITSLFCLHMHMHVDENNSWRYRVFANCFQVIGIKGTGMPEMSTKYR